jgi:hypothetical protein
MQLNTAIDEDVDSTSGGSTHGSRSRSTTGPSGCHCQAMPVTKPNVAPLAPGDLLLLIYGDKGRYQAQLYLRVDEPQGHAIARTPFMATLPNELAAEQRESGIGRTRP